MKLYIWVHDRTFHSWSMINEPCLHTSMYSKASVMVMAETQEQAIQLLVSRDEGWRAEDLARLEPKVVELDKPAVLYSRVE